MKDLPTGTVTFLFSDIEASTRLIDVLGDQYGPSLELHQAVVRKALASNGGIEIATEGDSFFVAFATAPDGANAAVEIQQALVAIDWPGTSPMRVRIGLHSGEGVLGGDSYVGMDVHRASRIAEAGHGGQVLISDATRSLCQDRLPNGAELVDLGNHTLKDIPTPERIYQVSVAGLDASFPALRTVGAAPNNLPSHLTGFIGRDTEIEEVNSLLDAARLVTLVGPGGVGKTRLSLQAASGAFDRFPDGVWLADLTRVADPGSVTRAVAEPLGVVEASGEGSRPLIDVLTSYLTGKATLLILDNCEHVLEGCADLAGHLLREIEDLTVLATSREVLGVHGEVTYLVPPLTTGEHDSEAARLFIDRGARARHGWRPDSDERAAVASITAQLDGLPLAIELAAARVSVLTPSQILQRLDDRFRLLTAGRSAPDRHATLAAAMDWSYELLSPVEQAVLQRLSVFRGWGIEAAEAVLDPILHGEDSLEILSSLIDKSLIEVTTVGSENRYRLLETIRHYGLTKLDPSAEANARSDHAAYFLDFAERGDAGLKGPDQANWVSRVTLDHDNVRSAIEWASEEDHELALALVGAMSWYWFIEGHWQGPLVTFRNVYDESADAEPLLRAQTAYRAGGIAMIWGRFAEIGSIIEDADAVLAERGSAIDRAFIDHYMGLLAATRGEPDSGDRLQRAIAGFEAIGDRWGAAFAKRWHGSTDELKGDPGVAIGYQRQSVVEFEELGDRWSASWIAFVLGVNLIALDQLTEAKLLFERSIDLVDGMQGRLVIPHALRGLATVAGRSGETEKALDIFEEALPQFQRIGDDNCLAISRMHMGEFKLHTGAVNAARVDLNASFDGFAAMQNTVGMAAVAIRIARTAVADGLREEAAAALDQAETLRLETGATIPAHDRDLVEDVETWLDTTREV